MNKSFVSDKRKWKLKWVQTDAVEKGGLNKKRKRKLFLCFRKGELLYKKNLVNLISCYLCSIQYPRHLV
ncbi:unknown [Bacteroides sp. CAG:702]|nr:unknown [Bacteroides sp. CAG:702]